MNFAIRELYEQVANDSHLDALYYAYVEQKDKERLRELLTHQQKKNGYTSGYFSGSLGDRGTVYKRAEQNGIWTSTDKATAEMYAGLGGNTDGQVRKLAAKYSNPLNLKSVGYQTTADRIKEFMVHAGVNLPPYYYEQFTQSAIEEHQEEWFTYAVVDGKNWRTDRAAAFSAIEQAGYDCIILADTHYGIQSDSIIFFHSNQVKMDNLVTVDNHRIIPLSKRFNEGTPDIRY